MRPLLLAPLPPRPRLRRREEFGSSPGHQSGVQSPLMLRCIDCSSRSLLFLVSANSPRSPAPFPCQKTRHKHKRLVFRGLDAHDPLHRRHAPPFSFHHRARRALSAHIANATTTSLTMSKRSKVVTARFANGIQMITREREERINVVEGAGSAVTGNLSVRTPLSPCLPLLSMVSATQSYGFMLIRWCVATECGLDRR